MRNYQDIGSGTIVPISLPQDKFKWRTPQDEVGYWNNHLETKMPISHWNTYYCDSIQHKGLCCSSCISDEEYSGIPNFDDACCCKSKLPEGKGDSL